MASIQDINVSNSGNTETRLASITRALEVLIANDRVLYQQTGDQIPVTTQGDSFCLLYTSPSPRDRTRSRMPSSA